jgi:hypothetical protein
MSWPPTTWWPGGRSHSTALVHLHGRCRRPRCAQSRICVAKGGGSKTLDSHPDPAARAQRALGAVPNVVIALAAQPEPSAHERDRKLHLDQRERPGRGTVAAPRRTGSTRTCAQEGAPTGRVETPGGRARTQGGGVSPREPASPTRPRGIRIPRSPAPRGCCAAPPRTTGIDATSRRPHAE